MRVLLNCLGDYGHFHPLAVWATALESRGHEVRFATEESFAGRILASGFDAVGLPERDPPGGSEAWSNWTRELAGKDLPARAPAVLGWFWEGAVRAVPPTCEIIQAWRPNVLLREQSAWAGAIAAELTDLPFATFHFNPRPPGGLKAMLGDRMGRDLQRLGVSGDEQFLETDPYLGLVGGPEGWYEEKELGPKTRTVKPPLAQSPQDGAPPWLAELGEERPLIYVTMGTVFNRNSKLFRMLLDGLAESDVDALVTVGPKRAGSVQANQLGDRPDRIRVEEYVDQSWVLPKAAAVISHGGYGTTMGALAHGLPVICIPQAALDNRANAGRVVRLGAGLTVEDATAEAIANAISTVLGDASMRAAASRAAASIAKLSNAQDVALMIEEIAVTARGG